MKITYRELADRLDGMVLANSIVEYAFKDGLVYEEYNGSIYDEDDEPIEYFQYYAIGTSDGNYLADNTNETILYFEALDMHFWCIDHIGTSWDSVYLEIKE